MWTYRNLLRRQRKSLEKIFLFVHLPKCAGTSLLKTFNHIGKGRYIVIADTESKQGAVKAIESRMAENKIRPEKLDLIMGREVLYGMHDFSPRKPFYFTFLRDPIQRYISQYRFKCDLAKDPNRKGHAIEKRQVMRDGKIVSLKEFADRGLAADMMSRVLATAYNSPGSPNEWWCINRDESLSLALEMLKKMSFIGLFERLEDDVAFMCRQLRIEANLRHVNASQTPFDLDQETLEAIRCANENDIILYQSALSMAADLRQRLACK